jgi:hypothetical protein
MKKVILLIIVMSFFTRAFCGQQIPYDVEKIYIDLRNNVLQLSTKEKMKEHGFKKGQRLAILMETGLEDACYTLVAFIDGTSSLYFSNGGGVIGGGENKEGARAAIDFLDFSKKYENQFYQTTKYPLPKPGKTRFYIVKGGSILSVEFDERDLVRGKLPLSPLFHKGHDLITAMTARQGKKEEDEQRH